MVLQKCLGLLTGRACQLQSFRWIELGAAYIFKLRRILSGSCIRCIEPVAIVLQVLFGHLLYRRILYAYVTFGAFPATLVGRCSNEFGIHDRVGPRRHDTLKKSSGAVILL
jgi:hypothetical protein